MDASERAIEFAGGEPNLPRYLRVALSAAIVCAVLWLGTQPAMYRMYFTNLDFAIYTLCFFVVLLRVQFSLRQTAAVVGATAMLFEIDTRVLHYFACWQSAVTLLGLAAFGALALRVVWSAGEQRRLAVFTLIPTLLLHSFGWVNSVVHVWTAKAQPAVLDLYLYSFDASLRVQLPFLVGQLFERSFPLFLVCLIFYLVLEDALALAYACCLVKDRKTAMAAFTAFLIAGPIGVVFYNLFPALGPKYIFKAEFPWHPLSFVQASHLIVQPVVLGGVRNAMPSLHAAWAYLIFWYTRGLSTAERVFGGAVVVFTLFATMGTGEHYFIDLVVAIPFTLLVVAATNMLVHRCVGPFRLPLLSGLAMALVWLAALRYGLRLFWLNPAIPWAACIVTMAACFWMGLRLAQEEESRTMQTDWRPRPDMEVTLEGQKGVA